MRARVTAVVAALLLVACSTAAPPTTTTTTFVSTTTTATTTTVATTTTMPSTTTTVATTTTTPSTTTTMETTTTQPVTIPSVVVARGASGRREVALTFDAGSDRGYAAGILDLLLAEGIRGSFGMTGRWAEANPDLVLRMAREGHQLINHTYDHPHMETLSGRERVDELERADAAVDAVAGGTMRPFFRPPFGAYNPRVLEDVGAAGYAYTVMWTVDSLGWKGIEASEVADRCLGGAVPGAIYLFHVGSASSDFSALPAVVDGLSALGYVFVTVAEVIAP